MKKIRVILVVVLLVYIGFAVLVLIPKDGPREEIEDWFYDSYSEKNHVLNRRQRVLSSFLAAYYDEKGEYPSSLLELEKKYGSYKMSKIDNPFTPGAGYGEDYSDLRDIEVSIKYRDFPEIEGCEGMLLYQPVFKLRGFLLISCEYFDAQKKYAKRVKSADLFVYKKEPHAYVDVNYFDSTHTFEVDDAQDLIERPAKLHRLETTQVSLHNALQKYYVAEGKYPDSLVELQKYALRQKVDLDLYNPFTVKQGYGNAFWDIEKLRFRSPSHNLQLLPPGCGNMFLYQAAYQNQGYMIVYCPQSALSHRTSFDRHVSFVHQNKPYGYGFLEYNEAAKAFKLPVYEEEEIGIQATASPVSE